MTTAKDHLYQKYMNDPDLIPPEGKTKEELANELVDQKLRQSRNNSRAFELLSKDFEEATYAWDKTPKRVQQPIEKASPDKFGEPPIGHLKMMHRPFKILTGEPEDFTLLEPPSPNSEKTKNELKFVQTASKYADENPSQFPGIDEQDKNLLKPFLVFIKEKKLLIDARYLKDVLDDVATLAMYWKYEYNRPRPFQYEGMNERDNISADTPSYPSGHSLQAKVLAGILAKAYPEYTDDFERIGKDVGRNRIMGGWHFPSDHLAGRDLADQVLEKLPDNVDMFLKKSPLGEDAYMAAIRSSMQKHAEDFNIPVEKAKSDDDKEIEDELNASDAKRRQANVAATVDRNSVKEQKRYIFREFAGKLFPDEPKDKIEAAAKLRVAGYSVDSDAEFTNMLTNIHHGKKYEDLTPEEQQETYDIISSIKDSNVNALKTTLLGFVTPSKRRRSSTQSTTPETPETTTAAQSASTAQQQQPKSEAAPQPKTQVAETASQPETASEPEAPASEVGSGSVRTAEQRDAERAAALAAAPKATPRSAATGTAAKKPDTVQSESTNQEAPKADASTNARETEETSQSETAKKPAAKKTEVKQPAPKVEPSPKETVQDEPKAETTEETPKVDAIGSAESGVPTKPQVDANAAKKKPASAKKPIVPAEEPTASAAAEQQQTSTNAVEEQPTPTPQQEPEAQAETSEESTETAGTTSPSFRQGRLDSIGDDALSQLIDENHDGYHTLEAVKNTLLELPANKTGKKEFSAQLAEATKRHTEKLANDKKTAQAAQEAEAPSTGFTASSATKREIANRLRHKSIKAVVDAHIRDHVNMHGNDKKYDNISNLARHLAEMPAKDRMKIMDGFHKQVKAEANTKKFEALQQQQIKDKQDRATRKNEASTAINNINELDKNSTQHDLEEGFREAVSAESKHSQTFSENPNLKARHKKASKRLSGLINAHPKQKEIIDNITEEKERHGENFGGDEHKAEVLAAHNKAKAAHAEHENFLAGARKSGMEHPVFSHPSNADNAKTVPFTAADEKEMAAALKAGSSENDIRQDRIRRGLPPGSPPRPGLEWHKETHRWINPDRYKDLHKVLNVGETMHISDPEAFGLASHAGETPGGGLLVHKVSEDKIHLYSALEANKNKYGLHDASHEGLAHSPTAEQHARSLNAGEIARNGNHAVSEASLRENLEISQGAQGLENYFQENQKRKLKAVARGAIGGAALGALAGPGGALAGALAGGGIAYAGLKDKSSFTRDSIADGALKNAERRGIDTPLMRAKIDYFRSGSSAPPSQFKGAVGRLSNFVRGSGGSGASNTEREVID